MGHFEPNFPCNPRNFWNLSKYLRCYSFLKQSTEKCTDLRDGRGRTGTRIKSPESSRL
ncbi:hypothetical protein LEMLEM_LOCUS15295 [Lemmus lemmus]